MKRTALLEAELAKLRAEVEQKKSKLQEKIRETGVEVPVALKVAPSWLWPVIGIGSIGIGGLVIYYLKKKK